MSCPFHSVPPHLWSFPLSLSLALSLCLFLFKPSSTIFLSLVTEIYRPLCWHRTPTAACNCSSYTVCSNTTQNMCYMLDAIHTFVRKWEIVICPHLQGCKGQKVTLQFSQRNSKIFPAIWSLRFRRFMGSLLLCSLAWHFNQLCVISDSTSFCIFQSICIITMN